MFKKIVLKKQEKNNSDLQPDSYLVIKNELFDEVLKINSKYRHNRLLNYNKFSTQFQHNTLHPYSSLSYWYRSLKWMRFHVTATVTLFAIMILAGIIVTAQTAAPENFKPSNIFQPVISQKTTPNQKIGIILTNFTQCVALGGSLDIQNNSLICIFQDNFFKGPVVNKPIQNNAEDIKFNIPENTSLVDEPVR